MATAGEPTCGCQRGPNMEQGKWYGVRSYLHLFYEDCTGTHSEDNFEEAATSPTKGGRSSVFWKVRTSQPGARHSCFVARSLSTYRGPSHHVQTAGGEIILLITQGLPVSRME
uniref:Neurensin 2 n=1 Tax=Pseudonaja textilis TaxID=8673 RepID=A0A670ZCM4_PSETE